MNDREWHCVHCKAHVKFETFKAPSLWVCMSCKEPGHDLTWADGFVPRMAGVYLSVDGPDVKGQKGPNCLRCGLAMRRVPRGMWPDRPCPECGQLMTLKCMRCGGMVATRVRVRHLCVKCEEILFYHDLQDPEDPECVEEAMQNERDCAAEAARPSGFSEAELVALATEQRTAAGAMFNSKEE